MKNAFIAMILWCSIGTVCFADVKTYVSFNRVNWSETSITDNFLKVKSRFGSTGYTFLVVKRNYKEFPQDGFQEYDLFAISPTTGGAAVMTEEMSFIEIPKEAKGVRVFGRTEKDFVELNFIRP
jgi:hypothetical protein